jgi:hypothetical protein
MSTVLLLLAAAQAPLAAAIPSGFRAGQAAIVHEASGVTCPDVLGAGDGVFVRSKANQAGWRASCLYVSKSESKVSAAFSLDIAPVAGAAAAPSEPGTMLDVTALLMTRNAPAEMVTHVGPGVFTVRRAPETGKVERHVATRRGGWMINYSGVSTLARETDLAVAIDGLARRPLLDTSSNFASLPE